MEQIALEGLGYGAGWALLGVVVLAIIRGALVPRRTYDDKAHEASEWRAEARIKDQQIAVMGEQLGHLAEVGQTVKAIMQAQQRAAARRGLYDDEGAAS